MNTNFVSQKIKPLQFSETIERAQSLVSEYKYSYFPVVDEHIFMGNLCLENIISENNELKIEIFRYDLEPFFVREHFFWLDILGTFAENETNILPILSDKNEYIGYVELSDIIKNTAIFTKEQGDYLVVKKDTQHYTISEVAQIIESNRVKILGLFISQSTQNQTELTLKITPGNTNAVIQTFRRFGYNIVNNHTNDMYIFDMKEHSDYLEKYLNI